MRHFYSEYLKSALDSLNASLPLHYCTKRRVKKKNLFSNNMFISSLGLKPKVRDHYHSHRLSFWLNLIPRLHHPGEEQVYLRHHLLSDHENMASYDGIVRQIAFKFFAPIPNKSVAIIPVLSTNKSRKKYFMTTSNIELDVNDDAEFQELITTESILNFDQNQTTTEIMPLGENINTNNRSQTQFITMSANYSTALLVTIAIGCSLLILNMLIFAGVYYQLDKNSSLKNKANKKKNKNENERRSPRSPRSSRNPSHDEQTHSHYHYHDVNIDLP
jgi:neuroligin